MRSNTEGVVSYNVHPPNPTLCMHALNSNARRDPLVYPAGSPLKQTAILWAVSRSMSGSDEDGVRLFFLFRDVMGFYSCLCA